MVQTHGNIAEPRVVSTDPSGDASCSFVVAIWMGRFFLRMDEIIVLLVFFRDPIVRQAPSSVFSI